MKIAMLHVDLPNESRGGVSYQAHRLANALVDLGHDVTMFTGSPQFDECRYLVQSYHLKKYPRRARPFVFAWLLRRTDFSPFDVVHSHGDNYLLTEVHPQIRTFSGSAKAEAKSAKTIRRKIYQTIMIALENRAAQVADVCVGISQSTRNDIPNITKIVSCGVDLDCFTPGKKSAHPIVLFVGTMGGRKRGQLLATVFTNEIRAALPTAELWMVADEPVDLPGVKVYHHISTKDLAQFYRQAWVFCTPSLYEGFGIPYVEAMASGTAVVASPNPGANEVLSSGDYGKIVADHDLGKTIVTILRDPTTRSRMEQAGVSRAQEYSWARVCAQYEALYSSLCSNVGTGAVTDGGMSKPTR